MTITSVSNLSTTQMLIAELNGQSASLSQLSEQLASQQKYDNLTDYSATDALNLLNLQSSSTQLSAYSGVITTVQSRLSTYDTTMTDMESIISQAASLVNSSQNYNASTASSLAVTANNYLKSVQLDLNQQVNGRYIYGGSNYTTAPVTDLTSLTDTPSSTTVSSPQIPDYDTSYAATNLTFTGAGSSSLTIGGTTTSPASQNVSVVVGGTTYTYAATSSDTPTTIAAGLSTVLNNAGVSASSSGGVLTLSSGTITSASAAATSTSAYTLDTASVANGISVQYGVSSDNPAFQQLISGLRYIVAAGNSTDSTTYAADMKQASTLLTSALSSLQAVHTGVADNITLLTNEAATQSSQMTDIANQISDIQSVNVTQVSAEITALQTVLEASYTVTGDLEKMSITSYL